MSAGTYYFVSPVRICIYKRYVHTVQNSHNYYKCLVNCTITNRQSPNFYSGIERVYDLLLYNFFHQCNGYSCPRTLCGTNDMRLMYSILQNQMVSSHYYLKCSNVINKYPIISVHILGYTI